MSEPSEKPTLRAKLRKSVSDQVVEDREEEMVSEKKKMHYIPIDTDMVVSTGSTLVDLAISGGRVRGGGCPAGIFVEIFGSPGAGKTAILIELGASVQNKGGEVWINDPEARLDKEYTKIYGLDLPKENYKVTKTVDEVKDDLESWDPPNKENINMKGVDSIAALASKMELEGEDKMGMRKAKDLHLMFRKVGKTLYEQKKLVVFTNQQLGEASGSGSSTPGGKAIGFWASLRLQVKYGYPKRTIEKSKDVLMDGGKKVKHTVIIGKMSTVKVVKSSIDNDCREVPLFIINGLGIDDIRANLTWLKEKTGATRYNCVTEMKGGSIDNAIKFIEDHNLEGALREIVIDTWESIEQAFVVERKNKVRF